MQCATNEINSIKYADEHEKKHQLNFDFYFYLLLIK
jgi:hypothetical protein